MNKNVFTASIATGFMVIAGSANAALIDDFVDNQSVVVIGTTDSNTISGGTFIGTDRTVSASNTVGQTQAFVNLLTPSVLDASNTTTAAGTVSVDWTGIANADLTDAGLSTGLFLSIPNPIDNPLDVEFVINGTSSNTTAFPDGASGDDFFIPFAMFTDPGAFANVTTISMTLSDGLGWDASVDFVETRPRQPSIPEPPTIALMGLAMIGLAASKRRSRKG